MTLFVPTLDPNGCELPLILESNSRIRFQVAVNLITFVFVLQIRSDTDRPIKRNDIHSIYTRLEEGLRSSLGGPRGSSPIFRGLGFAAQTRFNQLVVQQVLTSGVTNNIVAIDVQSPGTASMSQNFHYKAPLFIATPSPQSPCWSIPRDQAR